MIDIGARSDIHFENLLTAVLVFDRGLCLCRMNTAGENLSPVEIPRLELRGRRVPAERAAVSAFDHGFLYGDGIFESLTVSDGRIFKLGEHLDRLVDMAHGMDREALGLDGGDDVGARFGERLLEAGAERFTVAGLPGA